MISIIGREVAVVACTDRGLVGVRGLVALESLRMLTIALPGRTVMVPKAGTVLQLPESGKLVMGDDMKSRLEDRIARGYRL